MSGGGFSGEDVITRMFAPVARELEPRELLLHRAAVRRAINDDGYIDPDRVLPAMSEFSDFDTASHTDSSSDTINPKVYLSTWIHLPGDGAWRVKATGDLTGRLNTNSNMNTYLRLNGQASTNFQVPLVAGDTGVAWPSMVLEKVSGEVLLELLFRPSAGTLTVEAGRWFYKAKPL